jgi:hypothetical protein
MRAILLISTYLAACGGPSTPKTTSEPEPEPAAISRDDVRAGCATMFARQRECTDTFIPALVGWRVELDVPAGVAARDREEGRDALVAEAMAEWAQVDDAAVEVICGDIAASIPEDQLGGMMELGERCLAEPSCDGFVACVEPAQRQRLEASR